MIRFAQVIIIGYGLQLIRSDYLSIVYKLNKEEFKKTKKQKNNNNKDYV